MRGRRGAYHHQASSYDETCREEAPGHIFSWERGQEPQELQAHWVVVENRPVSGLWGPAAAIESTVACLAAPCISLALLPLDPGRGGWVHVLLHPLLCSWAPLLAWATAIHAARALRAGSRMPKGSNNAPFYFKHTPRCWLAWAARGPEAPIPHLGLQFQANATFNTAALSCFTSAQQRY